MNRRNIIQGGLLSAIAIVVFTITPINWGPKPKPVKAASSTWMVSLDGCIVRATIIGYDFDADGEYQTSWFPPTGWPYIIEMWVKPNIPNSRWELIDARTGFGSGNVTPWQMTPSKSYPIGVPSFRVRIRIKNGLNGQLMDESAILSINVSRILE
jgi:hypothetical protein